MESKSENNNQKNILRNISLTSLGWELALPIFGGVFLGYQIDHFMIKSGYAFTIIMLLIGIITGYYNLYKLIELEMLRTKVEKHNLKNQGEA